MSNLFDLTGKVALVTGGTTGLGEGMAIGLAEAGADVMLVDITESNNTVEKITALGRKAKLILTDLSKLSAVTEVVDATIKEFGKIDILCINSIITVVVRDNPKTDSRELLLGEDGD